jgi:hypothetical protein
MRDKGEGRSVMGRADSSSVLLEVPYGWAWLRTEYVERDKGAEAQVQHYFPGMEDARLTAEPALLARRLHSPC